jgi:hypothetical protein
MFASGRGPLREPTGLVHWLTHWLTQPQVHWFAQPGSQTNQTITTNKQWRVEVRIRIPVRKLTNK